MLPWIICGVLLLVLIVSVRGGVRYMTSYDEAEDARAEAVSRCRRLEEMNLGVLMAFCRQDFYARALLVKVDAYEDEDRPGSWIAEALAAPYGIYGPFWKFGATAFVRDGRQIVRIWIDAEPGGYPVSLVRDFPSMYDDDQYDRGLRFIEIARRLRDGLKAYPHEPSIEIFEAFFGQDEPPHSRSCFSAAHVRAAPASSDAPPQV